MTRNNDNAVLNKNNTINNAENERNAIEWYVPHYFPSLEEYSKLLNQITKKTPTQLHYPEKFVFVKEVNTQIFWTIELGTQEGINTSIWVYVVFQQSDRHDNETLNNDFFLLNAHNIRSIHYRNQKIS